MATRKTGKKGSTGKETVRGKAPGTPTFKAITIPQAQSLASGRTVHVYTDEPLFKIIADDDRTDRRVLIDWLGKNVGIRTAKSELGEPIATRLRNLLAPIELDKLGELVRSSSVPITPITTIAALADTVATVPAAASMDFTTGVEALTELNTQLASVHEVNLDRVQARQITAVTAMDPRLMLAQFNHRRGKPSRGIASAAADELAVIARVASPEQWETLPDVVPGATLGQAEDGSWIVTGRIPIPRTEAIRSAPGVLSMKASQPVRPQLQQSVDTMRCSPATLPAQVKPRGGKGVVVGIVDIGGDFAHRNFTTAQGKTRLLGLWHQGGVATPTSPFGYGRLYSPAEINAALATVNPYKALGYPRSPAQAFGAGSHGTHVMDIAAGNGLGSTVAGIAPDADLLFVDVAINDIAWSGETVVKEFFGDSAQLLEAIKFVFETAGDRPCVVNVSLGTNGGPHDGTSLVEKGIDALLRAQPNRAVVIAAGNAQTDGIHKSGTIPGHGVVSVEWSLPTDAGGEIEFWLDPGAQIELEVVEPGGTPVAQVAPGASARLDDNGQTAAFISSRLNEPNNGCSCIGMWLAQGLPGGTWQLSLRNLSADPVDYHAWIERLDSAQSSFPNPTASHCLGSISTGFEAIAVGSYDAHKAQFPTSTFSSAGPTRDGRDKPELSAPGHAVFAARSGTGTGVIRKSGTSMAAPAVSGLIALIYAEAKRHQQVLTTAQLRAKLMAGLDPHPSSPQWEPQLGQGRASSNAI